MGYGYGAQLEILVLVELHISLPGALCCHCPLSTIQWSVGVTATNFPLNLRWPINIRYPGARMWWSSEDGLENIISVI